MVFEREGYRLLLDEGRTRETEILQGAENKWGDEMRELCERSTLFNHADNFVLSLRTNQLVKNLVPLLPENPGARDATLFRKFLIQNPNLDK